MEMFRRHIDRAKRRAVFPRAPRRLVGGSGNVILQAARAVVASFYDSTLAKVLSRHSRHSQLLNPDYQ